jgi:hypothetical protein
MTYGKHSVWCFLLFFGILADFVRKMLENPVFEGFPAEKETPEVIELQELKFGSGGRI